MIFHMSFRALSVVSTSLLLAAAIFAQRGSGETNSGMTGNEEIHGTVHFPPDDHSGVRALVSLQGISTIEIKGSTDQDGNFTFTHLRPDTYTLVVDAGDEYQKTTETVSIGFSGSVPAQGNVFSYAIPAVYKVEIYLRPRSNMTAPLAVPEVANNLFDEALKARRAGNSEKAIKDLNAAITNAPTFLAAYRELGFEYLRKGDGQLAVETFEQALKIEPNDTNVRMSYGVALLNCKRFANAESALRSVIAETKDYSVPAHYYLGLTLLAEQQYDEARATFEELVKRGGDRLPLAHRYLGGIYLRDKEYLRAANELEKYLKLEPKAPDAQKIRKTIQESQRKS